MASVPVAAWRAPPAGRSSVRRADLAARAWSAQAFEAILTWLERMRQRRQLGELSDHMLKDIGLSRADVVAETTKPFWRP